MYWELLVKVEIETEHIRVPQNKTYYWRMTHASTCSFCHCTLRNLRHVGHMPALTHSTV